MKHKPRKRFGQNFLQDASIIQQIIQTIHLTKLDNALEIGPGLGALTKGLLKELPTLKAIEIDRDLQILLQQAFPNLTLIDADALTVDYSQFGPNLRLIGNLPYNISTPLLFHLLTFLPFIQDMHFMLQKEVVDRMSAGPGSKTFGRLSVMVQYHCEVTSLLDIAPTAFYPEPKVMSSLVRLVPHSIYPAVDLNTLALIVTQAFSMRRKTLANSLKSLFTSKDLIKLEIDPNLRPEQLAVADYVKLAQNYPA